MPRTGNRAVRKCSPYTWTTAWIKPETGHGKSVEKTGRHGGPFFIHKKDHLIHARDTAFQRRAKAFKTGLCFAYTVDYQNKKALINRTGAA